MTEPPTPTPTPTPTPSPPAPNGGGWLDNKAAIILAAAILLIVIAVIAWTASDATWARILALLAAIGGIIGASFAAARIRTLRTQSHT